MDKKTAFNEALSELVSFATANGNKITMGEVKSHFDGLIDDDSQYRFIYDYLTVNKIEVTGFTPSDENFFGGGDDSASISAQLSKNQFNESKEELDFIEMYLEDIKKYPSISLEEQKTYLAAFLEGDISYYEKLIYSKLESVAAIAQKYRGQGVSFGDLIQEGNMEMMVAISEYPRYKGDFNVYIDKLVEDVIIKTIHNEINSGRISQHLADKLNQLDNTTKELSKKLGRVPEISELAEAMGTSEEEVSLLLKTSLDTLSINEDTHITDNAASSVNETDTDDGGINLTTPSGGTDPLTWRKHRR